MRAQGRKLDALVARRNNIAHGGREQKIEDSDIEEYRALVLGLMTSLEVVLHSAVESVSFRRTTAVGARSVAEAGGSGPSSTEFGQ